MKKIVVIGVCLIIAVGFPFTKARSEKGIISVGSINPSPKEEITKFQPFIDYLAKHLNKFGITKGEVVVAGSMEEMASLIKNDKVDIFIDSSFPTIKVCRFSGAKPFLRRWKKGNKEYSSVIFVRKDSGINTLSDLKGKIIAFENPYSTSAYLVPKAILLKEDLTLTEKREIGEGVSSDEVGYIFAQDEENIMVWVLRKMVFAGALDNIEYESFAHDSLGELKVLVESVKMPRQVVSHRANLRPELVSEIERVLINMDKDEEGKKILKVFEKTAKFDKFPKGVDESLKPIKELMNYIEKGLGK